MDIDDLIENFDALDSNDEKFSYIIRLGKNLPSMPLELKTEGAKVSGCMAQVWLVLGWDDSGRLVFVADSDSDIVRGLIAVLKAVYEGKTAAEANKFNIEALFERLGFENVTANRRNGFFSMVQRIKAFTSAPRT